jgi:hypothetical protein
MTHYLVDMEKRQSLDREMRHDPLDREMRHDPPVTG